MALRFSAYLSIYNDWDILPAALKSIASYVDELVVVDGAYDWMVPYLTRQRIDPMRSDPRVFAAIEASGIPFRVIAHTWKNEVEKRVAGYEACSNDYIFRVDADEIMFFNERELDTAVSCGIAVGEMEMPNYISPGWISRPKGSARIGRQCFLFDRRRITSEIHLNYLWLVLTTDSLPSAGKKPFAIYSNPLAFNAHLTGWRTPNTGVGRAAFYVLNWMRQNGVPWLPTLRNRPLDDMNALFDIMSPSVLLASLSRGRIAFGMAEPLGKTTFVPTPLTGAQEVIFTAIYRTFLNSLSEMNAQAVGQEQAFLTSLPTLLDLSTSVARDGIAPSGTVTLRFSACLLSAKVQLLTYVSGEAGGYQAQDLPFTSNGTDLYLTLPETPCEASGVIRQGLEFQVWLDSPEISQRFQVLT